MRQIRYSVAMSLDGYIAGPNHEFDWIIMDPDIDFNELYARFDTVLVGRRTFLPMIETGEEKEIVPGMRTYVFSSTLQQEDYPNFTLVSENFKQVVEDLREQPGKDIWLFGGGELFRRLNEENLIDGVDVAIIPVLLGGGVPLLPVPSKRTILKLTGHRIYSSGIASMEYTIEKQAS